MGKNLVYITIGCAIGFVGTIFWMGDESGNKPLEHAGEGSLSKVEFVERHPAEMTVHYNHHDQGFELSITRDMLSLQMRVSPSEVISDKALDVLKGEVIRLVSGEQPILLGDTGVFLELTGKFPSWSPSGIVGPSGHYRSLCFATAEIRSDNLIMATMPSEEPHGYYPYELLAHLK